MTIAAADSWWADWPKFLPGWLAFVVTVSTLIHKWWTRRHKVALGPDDAAVREALTTARSLFSEIIARHGVNSPWFQSEEDHRGIAQRFEDLAARRDDKVLTAALTDVVEAWNKTVALAIDLSIELDTSIVVRPELPGPRPPEGVVPGGESRRARKRRLEVQKTAQETLARQVDAARSGVEHVEKALDRLNKLERRTFGRS